MKNYSPNQIITDWDNLKSKNPGIRAREAAHNLKLSEGQLIAALVGSKAKKLKPNWKELLKRLPELGYVMSLTRNESCVLEHKGVFEKVNVFGKGDHHMATVIGPIETRVFLKSWHAAYAVEQKMNDRELTSIQIFDYSGDAITKIYLQENSNRSAYEKLVNDLVSEDQNRVLDTEKYEVKQYDYDFNTEDFLGDWSKLEDTHDFFPMLSKYNAQRHYAVKVADGKFSYLLENSAIQEVLEKASKQKLPIMIFAGNRGNLQIHQNTVRTIRLLERGEKKWLNVLDPDFNMHLRIDLIKNSWVVTKPTKDGDVTSIECFDANNELVVQFFGLRKPGIPELGEWRDLVKSLNKDSVIS